MKKNDFYTLLAAVAAGLVFSLGMCMCLIKEWNAFGAGAVLTAVGAVALIALGAVRFVKSGKRLPKLDKKLVARIALAVGGALVLGGGMSMIMVWQKLMIPGIIAGVVGILMLLCLIPLCKGLK